MAILSEGQKVNETYEVERFLGEGAFAEVYRVKHRFLGRQAMKVFKTLGMTIDEIETMLGEALLLSQIGHPNIVRVFDANISKSKKGDFGYFTMEYVAGGSLDKFWQSYGNRIIPIEDTVQIIKQICLGLSVAHSEDPPLVHRDIKPQNILIGYDASGIRARVSDFGLAKHVNPLTLLASAKGTIIFKSPEVFKNSKSDSCSGDVWAIGCILYLLITDRLPFAEITESEFFEYANFETPITPPSRLNLSVNMLLEKITLKAIEIDPLKRYRNAMDLLKDLNRWKQTKAKTNQKDITSVGKTTKSALGEHTPMDETKAAELFKQAMDVSKFSNKLNEAADMLEQAFLKWPEYKEKYEYLAKLWRKGISR
ncbi:MAG: serine/threonine-protein kinase [Candidatus Paceibacterota bacterium]